MFATNRLHEFSYYLNLAWKSMRSIKNKIKQTDHKSYFEGHLLKA